jgi:hypothetical protein
MGCWFLFSVVSAKKKNRIGGDKQTLDDEFGAFTTNTFQNLELLLLALTT